MKKALLLIMMLAVHAAHANHGLSELKLEAFHDTWITVSVDHHYLATPARHFKVHDLAPGNRHIEVFGFGNYPHGPVGAGQRIFSGFIHIPAASAMHARINQYGQFKVKSIVPKLIAPPVFMPVHVGLFPMSALQFGDLLRAMESRPFDKGRLLIARQAIGRGWVSSEQVRRLMEMFAFESTKLELAKYAYGRVVDPDRYYIVNDGFTFESSIRDLDRYIRSYG